MTDSDEVKLLPKAPEPLPCPFCGSEARLANVHNGRAVVCSNARCDASSATFSGEYADGLATTRWNTRPPVVTDEVVERVARAICIGDGYDPDEACYGDLGETAGLRWQGWKSNARAALAAMPAVVSGGQGT